MQIMCFPGLAKEHLTSSQLIDPGKWRLDNVSVDPPRPRMLPPLPDRDPLGDLSGQQTALCFFAKTRSYRDEYSRYREWKCIEVCNDCGPKFRTTSYIEHLGNYEKIRREREQMVQQIRAMIPLLRCMELLRGLR